MLSGQHHWEIQNDQEEKHRRQDRRILSPRRCQAQEYAFAEQQAIAQMEHPMVLIEDPVASDKWLGASGKAEQATGHPLLFTDLFADSNGTPMVSGKTGFYPHHQEWSNRMIPGESLQVTERLGVNHLGAHGRWAFAEFADVFTIESDFQAKVESEFNRMIQEITH